MTHPMEYGELRRLALRLATHLNYHQSSPEENYCMECEVSSRRNQSRHTPSCPIARLEAEESAAAKSIAIATEYLGATPVGGGHRYFDESSSRHHLVSGADMATFGATLADARSGGEVSAGWELQAYERWCQSTKTVEPD